MSTAYNRPSFFCNRPQMSYVCLDRPDIRVNSHLGFCLHCRMIIEVIGFEDDTLIAFTALLMLEGEDP